jgi:hypothetical protein
MSELPRSVQAVIVRADIHVSSTGRHGAPARDR